MALTLRRARPGDPPIESLRRLLPADHLWPIDSVWEYHAGGMSSTLSVFTEALNRRYGASASAEEYSAKPKCRPTRPTEP